MIGIKHRTVSRIMAFVFFILLTLTACKKDQGFENFGDYPPAVGHILKYSCATQGCHNHLSYPAASNLNLMTWKDLFKGSSSGSPVIPFNSKFSSLCYFINTYDDLGIKNIPTMPLNNTALSYDKVKLIKEWIDHGAPDVNGNIFCSESNRKKVYAVNQGCDVVTVFDAETQLPIRYIDVGIQPGVIETPHQIRVSPDGQFWYVNFINGNVLQKFSCADDKWVANIPLTPSGSSYFGDWNTFLITKDSKKAFCVSWKQVGKLVCLDLVNNRFVKDLTIADNPHAIALSPDESKVYVGAQMGNYINEIDTQMTNLNPISMNGLAPSGTSALDIHDMVMDAANNRLIMTCQKTNEVRVYDFHLSQVTATITVGIWPQEIVYSALKNQFFITCMNDNTFPNSMGSVARIDNGTWASVMLPVGYMPHGICIDDSKKLIYVLSRNLQTSGPAPHHTSVCAGRNGFVNFIDLNSFSLLPRKYELSVDPYFISAIP